MVNNRQNIISIMDTIFETKRQLRAQCKQIRAALGEEVRRQASQAICHWIETWLHFQESDCVLTYMPMRGEVDLRPLLALHPQKHWLLPRILPEGRMVFHSYDPDHLILHPYGMLEPDPDLPVVPVEQIELALIPSLAYDRQGWRLGYGGGYFDRSLAASSHCTSLGVTYQSLLLDHLPHQEHDVPVQYVVTEVELFQCPTLYNR